MKINKNKGDNVERESLDSRVVSFYTSPQIPHSMAASSYVYIRLTVKYRVPADSLKKVFDIQLSAVCIAKTQPIVYCLRIGACLQHRSIPACHYCYAVDRPPSAINLAATQNRGGPACQRDNALR